MKIEYSPLDFHGHKLSRPAGVPLVSADQSLNGIIESDPHGIHQEGAATARRLSGNPKDIGTPALTRCTDVHTKGEVDFEWDEGKAASNLQKIRIISARRATPSERRTYERNLP